MDGNYCKRLVTIFFGGKLSFDWHWLVYDCCFSLGFGGFGTDSGGIFDKAAVVIFQGNHYECFICLVCIPTQ